MKTKQEIEAFALGMICAFEQDNQFEEDQLLTFTANELETKWVIDYNYIDRIERGLDENPSESFEYDNSFVWLKSENINRLAKNIQDVIEECYNSEIRRC